MLGAEHLDHFYLTASKSSSLLLHLESYLQRIFSQVQNIFQILDLISRDSEPQQRSYLQRDRAHQVVFVRLAQ